MIGNYIKPGYFGGTYVFNKGFYVLGMPTATLPVYSAMASIIMVNFIEGNSLGLAFQESISKNILPSKYQSIDAAISQLTSTNSRYIIGDGTLKLQSKKLEPTVDKLSLKYLVDNFEIKINKDLSLRNAVLKDDHLLVEYLISQGGLTNEVDEEGNTLLHLAVKGTSGNPKPN